MIQNFMLLPFYELKEQQFRFRDNCNLGEEAHSFRIPNYSLPSFFFKREKRPQTINYFYVYDINDNLIVTMGGEYLHMVSAPTFDGFGYVSNKIENGLSIFDDATVGDSNFNNYLLPCGKYYIRLEEEDTVKKYYSEVFEVVDAQAVTDKLELVINGGFDNLDNWVTSGTWIVGAGIAQYLGAGGGFLLSQFINTTDDDQHFYKVQFTISDYQDSGDATKYIRVYFNGLDSLNSVVVKGNGTYTYYVKNVSRVVIQSFNGEVRFGITDISVQKVIGHKDHVSLLLSRDCRFPNSIDKANYNYFNYYLLDALILEPEYGEVIKEEENGDMERVISFARPFKKHRITPMLLPEPVADALSQLNTFDIVELYDGIKNDLFRVNSVEDLVKVRSIQSFDVKIEWQQPVSCYMLADIGFEESIYAGNKCCDDAQGILACFDPEAGDYVQPEITVTFVDGHFHIALSNTPVGMEASFVNLQYSKQASGDYTDCNAMPEPSISTGIIVPYAQFAADGIDFYANELAGYAFKFAALFTQVGCANLSAVSTSDCHGPCISLGRFNTCYTSQFLFGHTVYTVECNMQLTACDIGEITIELYNSNTSTWFEPAVNSYPLPDGDSTPNLVFDDTLAALASYITKVRLRYSGNTYAERTISMIAC